MSTRIPFSKFARLSLFNQVMRLARATAGGLVLPVAFLIGSGSLTVYTLVSIIGMQGAEANRIMSRACERAASAYANTWAGGSTSAQAQYSAHITAATSLRADIKSTLPEMPEGVTVLGKRLGHAEWIDRIKGFSFQVDSSDKKVGNYITIANRQMYYEDPETKDRHYAAPPRSDDEFVSNIHVFDVKVTSTNTEINKPYGSILAGGQANKTSVMDCSVVRFDLYKGLSFADPYQALLIHSSGGSTGGDQPDGYQTNGDICYQGSESGDLALLRYTEDDNLERPVRALVRLGGEQGNGQQIRCVSVPQPTEHCEDCTLYAKNFANWAAFSFFRGVDDTKSEGGSVLNGHSSLFEVHSASEARVWASSFEAGLPGRTECVVDGFALPHRYRYVVDEASITDYMRRNGYIGWRASSQFVALLKRGVFADSFPKTTEYFANASTVELQLNRRVPLLNRGDASVDWQSLSDNVSLGETLVTDRILGRIDGKIVRWSDADGYMPSYAFTSPRGGSITMAYMSGDGQNWAEFDPAAPVSSSQIVGDSTEASGSSSGIFRQIDKGVISAHYNIPPSAQNPFIRNGLVPLRQAISNSPIADDLLKEPSAQLDRCSTISPSWPHGRNACRLVLSTAAVTSSDNAKRVAISQIGYIGASETEFSVPGDCRNADGTAHRPLHSSGILTLPRL